jgi:hypothetical protein
MEQHLRQGILKLLEGGEAGRLDRQSNSCRALQSAQKPESSTAAYGVFLESLLAFGKEAPWMLERANSITRDRT